MLPVGPECSFRLFAKLDVQTQSFSCKLSQSTSLAVIDFC